MKCREIIKKNMGGAFGEIFLIHRCQCKISLPTQVYMFSIRRSRLYTSVCTLHVSMSCVAYRCTDPGP